MFRRSFALAALVVSLVGVGGGDWSNSAISPRQPALVTTNTASSTAPADPLDLSMLASSGAIPMAAPVAMAVELPPVPEVAATPATQPEPEPLIAPAAQPRQVAAVAPVAPPPAAPAVPATCPASYFCYPRVGIAGPIVPYGDCEAATDVGTAIRSLTCVSPRYLAAHAYTQFGRITGWRAGDIVSANGVRYVLFNAFTQRSCDYPVRPLAPLSLQTSLTSTNCGLVLVVQGRPE